MASLLLPPTPTATSSTVKHNKIQMKLKPNSNAHAATCNFFLSSNSNANHRFNSAKCHALLDDVAKGLLESSSSVGVDQFQRLTEGLSDMQRWEFLVFGGLTWIYLTARPGVLVGAIDAYLLAPLQLGLDNLSGRRNLKRSDFVVGDKLGEGSFGVVYSGILVPKNVDVDVVQKRGRGKTTQVDAKSKDKVILKKVFIVFFFFSISLNHPTHLLSRRVHQSLTIRIPHPLGLSFLNPCFHDQEKKDL